jgi:hypothetical protein
MGDGPLSPAPLVILPTRIAPVPGGTLRAARPRHDTVVPRLLGGEARP